jgi:urea transport system ATP-binding protein
MLAIDNLNVAYGQSRVIHDLSFKVGNEEILAIMGRNGMGKTTLLKSLIGILPSRSGSIKLKDQEIAGLLPHERVRRGISFVPQGRMIFPTLTVRENILTGARGTIARDVWDEIYALFPILLEMRHRKGGNLSGGQQQQLAIGRALVMRPRLLLLDEPTEGIQPSIIKDIGRAISYLRSLGKIAIVLVEQYLDFAHELGDYFAVMERGAVVYASARAELDEGALKRAMAI